MPKYVDMDDESGPVPGKQKRLSVNNCGTKACIAGWTTLAMAPSLDLKLPKEDREYWDVNFASDLGEMYVPTDWAKDHNIYVKENTKRTYRGKELTRAGMHEIGQKLLGLSDRQAQRIFAPDGVDRLEDATDSKAYMVDQLERLLANPDYQDGEYRETVDLIEDRLAEDE
jgi:hypothetical protein